MDIAVVYESMFGNTREVAEAIAAGVSQAEPSARVTVTPVTQAAPEAIGDPDLLIVGGPTHVMRMTSERTRRQGLQSARKADEGTQAGGEHLEPGAAGPGVREWLATLRGNHSGHRAAAFDTRLKYPLSGGAARPIARQLRHHGYELAAKPEGFVVDEAAGPLHEGERDRARAWGAALVGALAA